MSLMYFAGNQNRAARIAREIVSELAPTDIECAVSEAMRQNEFHRLFMAVNKEYLTKEKRLYELDDQIAALGGDELQALFNEYSDTRLDCEVIKMVAWFNLGFAAALRLLGKHPRLSLHSGGRTERLKGTSRL